jgi:Immunoglobulin I-set domain
MAMLFGAGQAHATQTVRELFDKIGNSDYITVDGLGGGASSLGLQGTWTASPRGTIDTNLNVASTGIVYKDTWSVDWPISPYEYDGTLLGHSAGQNGLLNFNSGGNLNTLLDPDTALAYGNFTSKSYATRPLVPGAYIDFKANGIYYFSVRIVKGYPWNAGDNSQGFGFSTGGGTNDHFVGVGVTRNSTFLAADGLTELTNTSYISVGTLGQAGITGHEDDSGGVYHPNATGAAGLWAVADGTQAGLLVARLTTTTSGASTLDVKSYLRNGSAIDMDPGLVTWDATHSFTETNIMTQLLVWLHGTGAAEYDAIRVGTTWGDVIGFELTGAPKGNPANTVFEGVAVTISQNAGLNSGVVPMSFQWQSNGVPIVDATNATLVFANPTPAYTANYSVTLSNFYGGPVTSPETLITILPGVKPFFAQQPQPLLLNRYVGAPSAKLTVIANGTPPFTYQWQHAGTNIQSATTTANVSNTLTIAPVTLADAGNYSVTITNAYGSTNSTLAVFNVIAPAAGTFAAALTSLPTDPTNLFGYWRMDDNATTNDPTLNEYWNGNNGQVNTNDLSIGKITPGVEGAPYPSFPAPHWATALGTHGELWDKPYRVDLRNLPSAQTNMTFTMWVKGGVRLAARAGYGQAYGLENNGTSVRVLWGAYDSTNGVKTATWDTGLIAPADEWAFVALVVNGNNATVYVGSTNSFTSASSADVGGIPDLENGGYMTLVNSTTLNESNLRLGVGRTPIPWADDGNGAPWTSTGGTWSDIAVFYQVLTAGQIKGLFLAAGAGRWLEGIPDGSGNLTLNWTSGTTLQEAENITGPWTDIGSATPPYSVPISTTGTKFYRVNPAGF